MQHKFLIHSPEDTVGVAVAEIREGEGAKGVALEEDNEIVLSAQDDIPLGHKIAIVSLEEGDAVIKYGVSIGKATKRITQGEHVHTHNLKSARW